MTYSFEPVKKEFEERFVKIGKYGDIPIPPAIALRFLEKSTKEAYEQGLKDAEGTKNGVGRYQLGYRDGRKDAVHYIKQHSNQNKKLMGDFLVIHRERLPEARGEK